MNEIYKFSREEEDGSKTYNYAINHDGTYKTHNNKGPAVVNETQKVKEYYLFGLKLEKEEWDKRKKLF
jgi:hypothetical protein